MEREEIIPGSNYATDSQPGTEASRSGVSWAAVAAGAFGAAALWLILLALGAGLGLSSMSVWSPAGSSAKALAAGAIIWLILSQILSSSMGGYLAGRLRTKWVSVHTDEVYFRDTAHGFLAWSVALVVTAGFLTSATFAMLGQKASSASERGGAENSEFNAADYYIDQLFRPDIMRSGSGTPVRAGVQRIFANGIRERGLSATDQSYLTQVVAATTGLNEADAGARVSDVFARAQQSAEDARKALAHSLLWAFLSLLIGAFCASFAATMGGSQRDHVAPVASRRV